ncbi:hypothetical protein [Glycomyces sp. NRRL B-16210]|uniref:hypothetical protein n=1 Tax=Glycomyces sp. NRRL B-16210 TaxID=1463821 RepID=UPI00105ED376|nr:hypothetical protein [Glycomyces sp. NRRL B-16210]
MADLVSSGPFPSEEGTVEEIAWVQELLLRILPPITDEEARALLAVFGPDYCYGLSGTLVHLIETAPGIMSIELPRDTGKLGIERLIARREFGEMLRRQEEEESAEGR